MSFITTIEARMTSTRLPGKVMSKINGIPILEMLIRRIKKAKNVSNILIATTTNDIDNQIEDLANACDVKCFRGSEEDVLGRLSAALKKTSEEYVIQLTGDNPLIDPAIIDFMANFFKENNFDFITNNGFMNMKDRDVPLGMDVSIFKKLDLINNSNYTEDKEDREHPTLYFYRGGKNKYRAMNVKMPKKWKNKKQFRLTLDTEEDFIVINKICNHFREKFVEISLEDILYFLNNNDDIARINTDVKHKIPSGL